MEYPVGYRKEFIDGNIIFGRDRELILPMGEVRRCKFAIVELFDIIASHNEKTFADSPVYPLTKDGNNINDRNYKDDKNAQGKVIDIAQNIQPNIMISTSATASGTPIITTDGIVVSGNNRTMSLKLAVSEYPKSYQAYLKVLANEIDAGGYGFTRIGFDLVTGKKFALEGSSYSKPKSTSFKHPVLVRIDYDFPEYSTVEMAKYNKSTQKSERGIDEMIKLSNILKKNQSCYNVIAGIMAEYDNLSDMYSVGSSVKAIRDALISCEIITGDEVVKYFHQNGQFTNSGKDLFSSILSGMILSRDALQASEGEGVKSMRNVVVVSIVPLIKNSKFEKDASLINEVNKAITLKSKLVGAKEGVFDYLSNFSMFKDESDAFSKRDVAVYLLLEKGQRAFKKAIVAYNQGVENSSGADMFGDAPTKEEVFQSYILGALDKEDKVKLDNLTIEPLSPVIKIRIKAIELRIKRDGASKLLELRLKLLNNITKRNDGE